MAKEKIEIIDIEKDEMEKLLDHCCEFNIIVYSRLLVVPKSWILDDG